MNSKIIFNKKAISPLIATILLVVVAVAIIAIILSWGKGFATDSLSSTKTIKIYTESENGFFLNVKDSINGRTYVEYSPPPNSPITSLTFTGYSLLGYNNEVPLDPPVTIKKGETAYIDHGIILNTFGLVLYQDNQRMITKKNIKQRIIQPSSCPQGYIPVPGNYLYGTMNEKGGFCVAKYEMKMDQTGDGLGDVDVNCNSGYDTWSNSTPGCSSGTIVSSASGWPIANISQLTSKTKCEEIGRHLISNNEWMTIVRNLEMVPSNWSTGIVGSGYIYSGHNDGNPNKALEASIDSNGYAGTNNTSGYQRRTLTLTNGEVIWDLAGNVWEWTDNNISLNDQPEDYNKNNNNNAHSGWGWANYSLGGEVDLYIDSSKLGFTSLKYKDLFLLTNNKYNADSTNGGIGRIYTYSNINNNSSGGNYAFLRGGGWDGGTGAGVLSLGLGYGPSDASSSIGFRCVQ